MQINNFILTERLGTSATTWSFRATVDVSYTTGFLFWKKTVVETKKIYKNYACHWYWEKSGTFTPDNKIENAERAWQARNGCMIENYVFPKNEEQ